MPPAALSWAGGPSGVLRILDQTALPARVRWLTCRAPRDVYGAIRALRVRGAPAIGVAAAYGMVLAARGCRSLGQFARAGARLEAARPTAVNLSWAVRRMLALRTLDPAELLAEARAIHLEDSEACRRIGLAGLPLLRGNVLTHCNAGSLATAGCGTALAAVYEALARGRRVAVWSTETRPLFQGARLTAWELSRAGADVTILVDSAAAGLLASGRIGCVFVGADRIAANGDTANKVGTLAHALAARAAGVPFYVAAPRSTFDSSIPDGRHVRIEQRASEEVTAPFGLQIAPRGVPAWNPAFDVTPARLITAFVTDAGVLRPPFRRAIRKALASKSR